MRQLLIFTCLFILSTSLVAQQKLVFAIDVIRHGDRTPIYLIKNLSYPWKEGLGELTAIGMQQHLELGEKLRKRYIEEEKLLPLQYDSGSLYVRSTDYNRALMSAQALLMGLYPLGTGPMKGGFQPIPIHSQPKEKDILISNEIYAEKFEELLKKLVFSSAYWQEMESKMKTKWSSWEKLAGFKIENLNHLRRVGNSVYIYQLYNVPFPPEFSKNEINELIHFHSSAMPLLYQPKEIGQLLGREQLKLVTQYIIEASQQKNLLKYVLLSAHDSTLLSLMSAMGTPLDMAPPYAAHLSFALYESESKQLAIVVRYNDQIVSVPGCRQKHCTLEEFASLA